MSHKINILPEHLINQIAAGEVVERPASVVKELIENSIDAGTTNLVIEIVAGGSALIGVTDNGSGMSREDAILCFERHATSKIKTLEDLAAIKLMGFRGEALASIAAVAKVTLSTRQRPHPSPLPEGEGVGTQIENIGGIIEKVADFGGAEGTQILISDLFFNTPARKKFMKSENNEFQNVLEIVTYFAIAFKNISFKLIRDGKVTFDLPATDDDAVRLRGVLGKAITDELIPVFNDAINLKIRGFICKPAISRSSRNYQYLFVNNRPIKSPTLSYAVKNAYGNLIPKDRYPVFVINFELDPAMVDVNVHPRKTEVKFSDEKEIFRVLNASCKKALENSVLMPKFDQNVAQNFYADRKTGVVERQILETTEIKESVHVGNSHFARMANELMETRNIPAVPSPLVPLPTPWRGRPEGEGDYTPIFQFRNAFIVCQKGEDLIFIDQHAAHERIRYEKIKKEEAQKMVGKQPLLTPIVIELPQADFNVLNANKTLIEELGFELEHFGGNSFSIQAVPLFLAKLNLEKLFSGILDDLRDNNTTDLLKKRDQIIAYMACRSAVKFGDKLAQEEMQALVEELALVENKASCPHGRPTTMILTWDEMWNRFGRNYSGNSEKEIYQC